MNTIDMLHYSGQHQRSIFSPGLVRDAAQLDFAPKKRYAYVENPLEGWRVYIRSCAFIYDLSAPWDARRFLVVKRTGANNKARSWEPPKGQMEGKDINQTDSMADLLLNNIRREVEEESGIRFNNQDANQRIHYSGLFFEGREPDYPEGHYFQYHIFIVFATPAEIRMAEKHFQWIHEHPSAFARFRSDRREKDAIAWYSPETRMMGRWSPRIVPMYLERMWGIKS